MENTTTADKRKCARAKTAIAEEVGSIQGMAERFIAESDDYLMRRIPQGTFDHESGERPRTVRYSSAPVPDSGYRPILTEGHSMEVDQTRGFGNDASGMEAKFDKRGAAGCELPGDTITGGYDEFYREVVGKAWETEPMCAMELVLKRHVNEYIHMLRNDLPMRAKEQFNYELERRVIEFGFYNISAVGNTTTSEGYFDPQRGYFKHVPNGGLDLGLIRTWFRLLKRQGWTGPREVGPISEEAFNQMRRRYKESEDMEVKTMIDSDETGHIEYGTTKKLWGGITWIIGDTPTRGFLRPIVGPGGTQYEFVQVFPTVARAGTGEGIVTDINPDYDRCFTIDPATGQPHELFEVAYAVHPTSCERQAFNPSQIADKRFDKNMFNFDINFIDGPYLDCNLDNFKFMFRLLHAYAFSSEYPERMGAVIYRVSPDRIFLNVPACPAEPTDGDPVLVPDPPIIDAECGGCEDYVDPDTELDEVEAVMVGKEPFYDLDDPGYTAKDGDGVRPQTGYAGGDWQEGSGLVPAGEAPSTVEDDGTQDDTPYVEP